MPRRTGPLRKTTITRERKVEKCFQMRQNERNDEGYKRSIDKNCGPKSKNGFSDQNIAFLAQKICFFLRYAHITHFYGLCQTRLNGIISSPCPQVTLDTFGFLVGACWAARRAVFWRRLPKMALFGAKNGIFGPQRPPRRPPCDDFKTKTLPIWCPVMMVTKKWNMSQ